MRPPLLAIALQARRVGSAWMARCPAHDDSKPSLSIQEKDGKVLIHCHAGCSQSDVIRALEKRGLWYREKRARSRRHISRRESAEMARIRRDTVYFSDAARLMAELALDKLSDCSPERRTHTALLTALRVSPESEYRSWLKHNAHIAAA